MNTRKVWDAEPRGCSKGCRGAVARRGLRQRARLGSCCRLAANVETAVAAGNSAVAATNGIICRIHSSKRRLLKCPLSL